MIAGKLNPTRWITPLAPAAKSIVSRTAVSFAASIAPRNVQVVSPTLVYINGKSIGETSIFAVGGNQAKRMKCFGFDQRNTDQSAPLFEQQQESLRHHGG